MSTPLFDQAAREHLLYNEPPTIEIERLGVEDYQLLPAVPPADPAPTGPLPIVNGGPDGSR